MDDCQFVTVELNGPPAATPPSGAYIDGQFRPLPSHCPRCGARWDVGHVASVTPDAPWQHTDCEDPELERGPTQSPTP